MFAFASVAALLLIELTSGVLAAVVDDIAADDVLLAGVPVAGVSVLASTIMSHAVTENFYKFVLIQKYDFGTSRIDEKPLVKS